MVCKHLPDAVAEIDAEVCKRSPDEADQIFDAIRKATRTVSGQLIARGDLDGSLLREDIRPIRGRMQEVYTAPSWQPFPWDTVTSSAPALPAHGINQSITVLANRE